MHVYWESSSWGYALPDADVVGVRVAKTGFNDEEECARARDAVVRQMYPSIPLLFPEEFETGDQVFVACWGSKHVYVITGFKDDGTSRVALLAPAPDAPPDAGKADAAVGLLRRVEEQPSGKIVGTTGTAAARGASRYRGVSWNKRLEKWRADITIKGNQTTLGYFDDEREAALAFDVEARRLGRDGRVNFPPVDRAGETV